MESTKGSEWRRWELHIHTPDTQKNDNFTGSSSEEKWENLLFQYDSLKRSLAEKYGEPQESIEKLGGCTGGSIEDLINGNLKFKTVFKSSIFGEIIISLLGFKESLSGSVYISYFDLLSLMIENKENKEDL